MENIRTEERNMIELIYGSKGTGKTKIIIDKANDNVETAKGDIVFITDTDELIHQLRYQIRIINASVLKDGEDRAIEIPELVAFIKGILSANYDIETLYIDGAHRMFKKQVPEMGPFYAELGKIAKSSNVKFVITVSADPEDFPEELKQYI